MQIKNKVASYCDYTTHMQRNSKRQIIHKRLQLQPVLRTSDLNYVKTKRYHELTIPVGQQTDQAIEARVGDFGDAGCTSAYRLNSGCCKLFVLAFHVGLKTV